MYGRAMLQRMVLACSQQCMGVLPRVHVLACFVETPAWAPFIFQVQPACPSAGLHDHPKYVRNVLSCRHIGYGNRLELGTRPMHVYKTFACDQSVLHLRRCMTSDRPTSCLLYTHQSAQDMRVARQPATLTP